MKFLYLSLILSIMVVSNAEADIYDAKFMNVYQADGVKTAATLREEAKALRLQANELMKQARLKEREARNLDRSAKHKAHSKPGVKKDSSAKIQGMTIGKRGANAGKSPQITSKRGGSVSMRNIAGNMHYGLSGFEVMIPKGTKDCVLTRGQADVSKNANGTVNFVNGDDAVRGLHCDRVMKAR